MRILLDTVAIWGLTNERDQHHRLSRNLYDSLKRQEAEILMPRISYIETIGHVSSRDRPLGDRDKKKFRVAALDRVLKYGWPIVDHPPEDFSQAEVWWREYADWTIDYPDALILATAKRTRADAIWTYDKRFKNFVYHAEPNIQVIGLSPRGNGR